MLLSDPVNPRPVARTQVVKLTRLPALQRLCVAIAMAVGVITAPLTLQAETTEQYQASIDAKNSELEQLAKDISEAGQQRRLLQQTIAEQQGKIQGRTQRVRQLDKDIKRFEQRLAEFESQSQALQQAVLNDHSTLADIIRDLQISSGNSGLKVMLQDGDPSSAGRVGVYIDYLMKAQQQRIGIHLERVALAEQARTEALKSRNWLQHIKAKALDQQKGYTRSRDQTNSRLEAVNSTVSRGKSRSKQLESELVELQTLLEELEKASRTRSGYFVAEKGKHFWPTWTADQTQRQMPEVRARFGQSRASGKLDWSGILIGARTGTAVHAIADGEAVFAGKLAGVGTLVVIDHGDGYLSLYGGNRKLQVKIGDWLEKGATIATVGKSGGPNPQGIYLEIRHNAVPIDPEQWLTAGKTPTEYKN